MHEVPSFQEEHCHLNIVMKTGDCLPWTKLFQPPHVGKQSLRVMSDCALVFVHSGCMRQGKSTCCTIMSKRPIFDSVLSSLGILGKENSFSELVSTNGHNNACKSTVGASEPHKSYCYSFIFKDTALPTVFSV